MSSSQPDNPEKPQSQFGTSATETPQAMTQTGRHGRAPQTDAQPERGAILSNIWRTLQYDTLSYSGQRRHFSYELMERGGSRHETLHEAPLADLTPITGMSSAFVGESSQDLCSEPESPVDQDLPESDIDTSLAWGHGMGNSEDHKACNNSGTQGASHTTPRQRP
jgi:hypothetical protein